MHVVCFANPGSPRVSGLRAAAEQVPGTVLTVVPWLDALDGTWDASGLPNESLILRLESPGKDWRVEKAILAAGAEEDDEDDPRRIRWWRIPLSTVLSLTEERGRILPMRQWQLGWRKLLRGLAERAGPAVRWFAAPEDVICMFDKSACQERLEAAGCTVPRSQGILHDYDHLMERMGRDGCSRVFLKPCHGSSSSGAVALEWSGHGLQAYTTVELVRGGEAPVMYNSRRVRLLRSSDAVRPLVDAVSRLRATSQVWMPKSGWRGHRMDLRVVVIGGEPAHVVPRLSRTPFTTLQLGAQRGSADELKPEAGAVKWERMLAAARSAAAAFPLSLCMGVDVLVTPGWTRAAVLEVNAFGDLLPGVLHAGRDTYTCELAAAANL